jgi:uncharacterized protein (DUF1499 family)
MSDTVTEPTRWTVRLGQLATADGIGAAALALIGSYGSGFGLWHFEIGFLLVGAAVVLAAIAVIAGLVALVKGRGTRLSRARIWTGMISAATLLGVMAFWGAGAVQAPMIHDVTTSLANTPTFKKLVLRADNLVGVGSEEQWRKLHAGAYSSISPLFIHVPQAEVMRRSEALVRARGWDVALVTVDRIEATETSTPFRFKDDIVITVAATERGQISQVEMRSVSRVGIADFGRNAARVRAYLADLEAGKGR